MTSSLSVRLVSHASILVETAGCRIWTDPWLFGKAFNDSWSLLGPVAWEDSWLDSIDYLWISHEHPDHFHLPTLRSLPESFKQHVTVLFQENNSTKMFDAFRRLGFPRHRALPHRRLVELVPGTRVYCYQVLPMDSALAVQTDDGCLMNLNDAELNARDCRTIRGDLGRIDVALNQFSIAGYAGLAARDRHLPELAGRVLDNVVANHRDLEAGCTIPIASFVYFSTRDNRYVNAFANTPAQLAERFQREGLECAVLFPGDRYEPGAPHDSGPALERWAEVYGALDELPYDRGETVPLDAVRAAFESCARDLADKYPRWLLRRLEPLTVRIPDLAVTVRLSLADARFEEIDSASESGSRQPQLEVNSQPLRLVFAQPFGMQTLGVSARLLVHDSTRSWKLHRILFSMYNAELYLRARFLFTRGNWQMLRAHLSGGLNQVLYRLSLMR